MVPYQKGSRKKNILAFLPICFILLRFQVYLGARRLRCRKAVSAGFNLISRSKEDELD